MSERVTVAQAIAAISKSGWPKYREGWSRPNRKQLKRLRDYVAMMRGIPARRVELSAWAILRDVNKPIIMPVEPECATLACGAGWAGIYPKFRKQGFQTVRSEDGQGTEIRYKRKLHFEAIHAFFGVIQPFDGPGVTEIDELFPDDISHKDLAIKRACAVLERAEIHTGEFA